MKYFRHYLNQLDRPAVGNLQQVTRANNVKLTTLIDRLKQLSIQTISLTIGCSLIGSGLGVWVSPAQAAPARKDWCGTIWSVENTSTLNWIAPATGVTTASPGPTSQITMPGGSMGNSVAAIGLHTGSGTMFAFDRTGTTGTLYKYKFGVDTTWVPLSVSGLVGLTGTSPVPSASNNLNKMTIDGNLLYLGDSTALALYTIPLNADGTLASTTATVETYSYVGEPAGTPPHNTTSNPNMNGGDITTDEYGDTYNITYNNPTTKAYFYKQDPGTRRWIYQGETTASASFAGAAFYKGDLYVKAGGQLQTVDLTRSGSGYTGWGNPVKNIGSASSSTSADLTACGTPNVIINKTQKLYTDAAATILAPKQTTVQTGQYIKYTITAQNIGDSWARAANIADTLPAGSAYVPNSATLNGTNLGMATYPSGGFAVNTPGQSPGILDFSAPPNIATLTFVVQVTSTSGSVQNRATITYVDNTGLVSETPICTAGSLNNCGETPVLPIDPVISGTVFEDVNYGGGAGRNLTTSSGIPRPNVTVELYDSNEAYKGSTTTDPNGAYSFNNNNITGGIVAGDYHVRVVNSTVTSSRPGAVNTLIPVQTYRTDAGLTAGTVTDVPNRVGGEKPNEIDAPTNTTSQTLSALSSGASQEAQSITNVKVGTGSITGIDFGYNFDTIVNTNDSGQGSLRQFIINSNALTNTGLAQSGLTAGTETSIFMISDGVAHSGLQAGLTNQLTAYGAAKINLTSILPTITDAYTAIDGRTQTSNIGNTNTSVLGDTTTIIGVGGTPLAGVAGPEVELAGSSTTQNNLILTSGNNTTFRSLAISAKSTGAVAGTGSTIRILAGADNTQVLESAIGIAAANDGTPGTGYYGAILTEANNVLIDKNLLRARGETVYNTGNITGWKITNNEISTSIVGSNSGNSTINFSNGANTPGPQNPLIQRNFLHNGKWGIQADSSNSVGAQFLDNTIQSNTQSGIVINFTEKNHTIARNVITGNGSGGVVIERDVTGVTISQNSIYANAGPGIDLASTQAKYISQGISPNDGLIDGMSGATLLGNRGIDYPVITSSVLNSGTLTVKGFVGNNPAGSTTFAGAKLEFFVADNTPADQNGQVILGDGKSKPHGEGKTYIGSCTADANSLFGTASNPCILSNVPASLTNANNITATATDSAGNTSEFSSVPNNKANVLLVKRITAINGDRTKNPNDNTPLNTFVDNTTTTTDNDPNWPSNYLLGESTGGKVKLGDEIEYTIYYLNQGDNPATLVKICDLLAPNLVFNPSGFASNTGFQLKLGTSATQLLTSANDPTIDRAQYLNAPFVSLSGCNSPTNTTTASGAVVLDLNSASATDPSIPTNLVTIPGATSSTPIPNNSYGWIRFKAKVK